MITSSPTLQGLLAILDEIAPPRLAEAWDNIGLLVGDPGQEVRGVLVALDVTAEVLAEAEDQGCNVVVAHHPLIFTPLPAVRTDHVTGRLLVRAVKQQIALVCCHTNLDKARGGVNDVLAASLGLQDCRVLAADHGPENDCGFGRVGDLEEAIPFADFIERLLAALALPMVSVAGIVPAEVSSVAVCGGSGSDLAMAAREAGAQIYITGEVKHHIARWAEDAGFCVVDAGHFSTEKLVVPTLVAAIAKGFAAKGVVVKIKGSDSQRTPFRHYFRE